MVYRARDPFINRLVALKTITTGLADDPALLQRFYREAQSAGGLQHPNIVTIYDMGDEQNTPYIAMELIEGESLEQVIARRTVVPLSLKLSYAMQACRAFDYAHKRGIIHRDIKPGNVMVNKEAVVKVVDFGIARVLDASKTQTGMLIGTFAYMSPEQYHGEHADERSDIWSFGVLLYELLCYQRPFVGDTPASLMHCICAQEPRPLTGRVPDCPPTLEPIVLKILRKAPNDRFQSMEDLLLELEPVYKEVQAHSVAELIDRGQSLVAKNEFAEARELLREAMKVDSSNSQARALLEKVNAEVKRLSIRPRLQQQVDKGHALLKEGKVQEARAEAENALQLDSSFEPARELVTEIQRELERAGMIAEWLQASGQRLAEGMPDEAEELLAKVLEMEPANKQAKNLQQQVLAEKAERQRRSRLFEKTQEARQLWTQLNYGACLEILTELQREFPAEEEIQRLLDTVREDQAEQHRQKTLEGARNLLAAGNYAESKTLLADLQRQFPTDEEIPRVLEDIRIEEAKQRRLEGLAKARTYLAKRQYEESIQELTNLEKEFQNDREILHVLELTRADQAEQLRHRDMEEARSLLAARRYDECLALAADLQARFPNDKELFELQEAIREDQTEQHRQENLQKAQTLLAARRWEDSITLLTELEREFPADEEFPRLLKKAHAEQAEQQRQKGVVEIRKLLAAKRYDECNALLAKLRERFPADSEVLGLQETLRREQVEQQKRLGIAEAKKLLAGRRYDEGNAWLTKLRQQFPDDSEVLQLQELVEKEQAARRKLEKVAKVENLLSSRNYDEAISILTEIGKQFPNDPDILRLLETAREEQAEKRRQRGMAEARNLLSALRYDDCGALLAELEKQFPDDSGIRQLQGAVREGKAEQEKLESLASARKLLAKGNYEECVALLNELEKRFPNEGEIPKLTAAARDGIAEQRKLKSLAEARNLLAARRYEEAVSQLTELNKEFPDEREISRLLANATKQHFERQKQEKLAAGRALLAAQRFGEALEQLDALRTAYPEDSAVQKLRTLVERERDKQNRSERLQRGLEALKKLLSEKKYSELLVQADPLRADFPANADLLRLIDFAQVQQARIESETRLQAAVNNVKARMSENRFTEAIQAADAALKAFPENAELLCLREQAEAREKKQRAQEMIEQRVREIKFKINRQDLSDAVELAKETIASLGPDTDLTHLLNSATIELQAREKKRQQEQTLQEIRTLVESGNIDDAAQTLRDAVKTDALDAFDPRVSRVSQEIEAAKSTSSVASLKEAPSAPANFSKEYAFLQGAPLDVEPPPVESAGRTETATPQASATQPITPSQPLSAPPPYVEPTESKVPAGFADFERSAPVVAAGSANRVGAPPILEQPRETKREPATARRRDYRRISLFSAIAIVLSVSVWAAVHFIGSRKPGATGFVPVQPAHEKAGSHTALTPNPPSSPSVSPAELRQQNALATSDKQIGSGDLKAALQTLQGVDKLNSPLTAEVKSRESSVIESMRNASLASVRQQEATLWTKAAGEVDKGEFEAAKRDFGKILVEGNGGTRKADARKYLDEVIPRREREEDLFRQAQESSQASDQQGLERASDIFREVIAFDGPRKAEAEAREGDIEKKLASLNQARQIAALEQTARSNMQDGDFTAARQNADEIKQAGGDASALLKQIDQAEAGRVRAAQERDFDQVVQSYSNVGSQDKSGLEKSRNDFLAIARGNGSKASQAQRYVKDIENKLDALNKPGPAQPPIVGREVSNTAADKAAIGDAVRRFFAAFEQRSPNALREVWPTIPQRTYEGYRKSFEGARAIAIEVVGESIRVNPDAPTATVSVQTLQKYTELKGGKTVTLTPSWTFAMSRTNGIWVVDDVQ